MCVMVMCICACAVTTERQYLLLESGSLNRAISLGVERTLFSVESAGLYFWRMRTSFLVECLLRVLNRRVAVAKDASPWQKQALNKLDASSMETTRFREPQGPLVASSLRSERYSPGPLRLSNARSFLDSTSNLYFKYTSVKFQTTSKSHTHSFLCRYYHLHSLAGYSTMHSASI